LKPCLSLALRGSSWVRLARRFEDSGLRSHGQFLFRQRNLRFHSSACTGAATSSAGLRSAQIKPSLFTISPGEALPRIFRSDDPLLRISLPQENHIKLEQLLEALPNAVFTADDSLGWVYQFWQAQRKDEVNKKGEKIGARDLAPVTKLFAEDYMVLFLLHNTLGAWWAAKRKQERKSYELPGYEWTYLRLKENGSPAAGEFAGWPRTAREITVLDPCMGSGHFLVFAVPILIMWDCPLGNKRAALGGSRRLSDHAWVQQSRRAAQQ